VSWFPLLYDFLLVGYLLWLTLKGFAVLGTIPWVIAYLGLMARFDELIDHLKND